MCRLFASLALLTAAVAGASSLRRSGGSFWRTSRSRTPIANSSSAPKPEMMPPCGNSMTRLALSRPLISLCRWATAGIPIAGGHSIDAPEPIYGLAVIGLGRPENIRRNSEAKPGYALILTKAIGVGIYAAAFKKGALTPAAYADMVASMTLLNRVGADLAKEPAVHAVTDVTGFGLLGHALEMARGANVTLVVRFDDLPLVSEGAALAQKNFVTGASKPEI